MLYLTTRDSKNACTAHKTLCTDMAQDGGLFVPYKFPYLEDDALSSVVHSTFGEAVAYILNLFFSVRLSGWDIDLQIGRSPIQIVSMNRKIITCELWKNPGSNVEHLIDTLYHCIATNAEHNQKATIWARTIIRVAILFGLYAQIVHENDDSFKIDISVGTQDMTELMAAYYARKIGLPIGQIICCCDAGDSLWDLLHGGAINTRNSGQSQLTAAELLICETLGHVQAQYFASVVARHGTFTLSEEDFSVFSAGIYPVAVGSDRAESVISSVRRSAGYSIDTTAAITFGGLQDYRAQTGESCTTMLLVQSAPNAI